MKYLYIYLIVINIITFGVYALDKLKAASRKWRIKEAVLIGLAFIGGSVGAILGMLICRHKIRKLKFVVLVPLFLIVHVIACVFLGMHIKVDSNSSMTQTSANESTEPSAHRVVFEPENGANGLRILMLGNSFTYFNNMPGMLSELTGAEVVEHVKGGGHLYEHLDPESQLYEMTMGALENEKWDYVVIQDHSVGTLTDREGYLDTVAKLCELIRENGATPILYETWAYKRDGEVIASLGLEYDVMYAMLQEVFAEALEANSIIGANVGKVFYENADTYNLYADDSYHPNVDGSKIAASVIAETITNDVEERG